MMEHCFVFMVLKEVVFHSPVSLTFAQFLGIKLCSLRGQSLLWMPPILLTPCAKLLLPIEGDAQFIPCEWVFKAIFLFITHDDVALLDD
jgi:hypothetical protein